MWVTHINGACSSTFFLPPPPPWGAVNWSNIIKFQLHNQFQRFLYQTVCVLTNVRYKTYQRGFSFSGCRLDHALYPYSTQAANRPNCHELIFFLIRGDSWGFINFFLQSWWATSHSRFRYDAVTNIRGNRLELRKNSLRLENYIRTYCMKVKESITNQLRICGKQHELGTN